MQTPVILITGGTSGIGLHTALRLARSPGTLVLAARDATRGQQAVAQVQAAGEATVHFLPVDLSLMRQVKPFAETFARTYGRLDVLIHSAGPSVARRTLTAEGLELMFAAQYLARFQLTRELLPLLEASGAGRILSIAGGGLARRELAYDNLNSEKAFSALGAVLQTSVANDLLGVEVNSQQQRVRMYVYGPGMVKGTGLSSGFSGPMRALFTVMGALAGRTPNDAAEDLVRLVREDLPAGLYQAKLKPVQPNAYASQQLARTRLWEASERLVGQALRA